MLAMFNGMGMAFYFLCIFPMFILRASMSPDTIRKLED